ncbi:hypothetical protein BC834DRAFT_997123 [Gloeopeniophorella convolvens]|nr:hypothetical protein BC834DRAFT_997123 [Gloeopeniophorella convolvens]
MAQQEASSELRIGAMSSNSLTHPSNQHALPPPYELTDLYLDPQGEDMLADQATARREQLLEDAEAFSRAAELDWDDWEGGDEDETVTNVAHMLFELGVESDSDNMPAPPPRLPASSFSSNDNWAPYPNKMMYLLDMLDNLPRLRLSDKHLQAFLFVLKECGAENVPSLDSLRRLQKQLQEDIGPKPRRHVSAEGNIYYVNDIAAQVAEDFTNPLVRPHMVFYPEDTQGKIVETWQAQKWLAEVGLEHLTPMVIHAGQHFYVNELAECRDGTYVLPVRWIVRESIMCSDVFKVTRSGDGLFHTDLSCIYSLPVSNLKRSFPEIVSMRGQGFVQFEAPQNALHMAMPHPTHIRAKGRPFFCVWIKLWGDDVSGNRSKQWNKHWNWYLAHAGIPKQLLNQEYFVRFVSTSPHAGILEQGAGICEQIRATKDGYVVFDCHLGEEVMFSLGVSTLPADNPMQSELASHIGLKGNCFCRRCNVGGTQEEKTTAEGFHALFMEVLAQVQDATRGQDVEDRQRKTGVKDALAQKFIQRVTQERIQLSKDSQLSSQELEERIDMWATSQRDVMNPFLEEPCGRSSNSAQHQYGQKEGC